MLQVDKVLKDVEKLSWEWFSLFLMRQALVNDQWNHHVASLKQINRISFPWKAQVTAMLIAMERGGQSHKWVKKGIRHILRREGNQWF